MFLRLKKMEPSSTGRSSSTSLFIRLLVLILSSVIIAAVQSLMGNGGILRGSSGARSSQVSSLLTYPTGVSLSQVGGHQAAKDELRASVLLPMRNPHLFYDSSVRSIRPPRGVLLCGPPGTGKTLLARAVACEAGVPLLTLHSAALESKWWGETPKLLSAIFQEARQRYAPCIIFIDEIDGMGRSRSEQDQTHVYSFKCELLRNMDSIEGFPVAVVACTNCPKSLDPALQRRFQRVLSIEPPTTEERESILSVLLRDESSPVDVAAIAVRTPNLTGADLTNLYETACAIRMREGLDHIEHVQNATELVGRMGALTIAHFEAAGARISRPLSASESPPSATGKR